MLVQVFVVRGGRGGGGVQAGETRELETNEKRERGMMGASAEREGE